MVMPPLGPRRTRHSDPTSFGANTVNFFNSHWERTRTILTPTNLKIGLFVLSIAAMVLGGAADGQWS